MSDGQTLYLVFCLLYLSDCFIWVRRGSIAFIGNILCGWSPKFASPYAGTSSAGIVRLNLLPPAGRVFCAYSMPISISPYAVVSHNTQTIKASSLVSGDIQQFSIDQIKDVYRVERKVLINDIVFCKCDYFVQAESIVMLIRDLRQSSNNRRDILIREFWKKQYNLDTARSLYSKLLERSKSLKICSNTLFVFLFILSPIIKSFIGINLAIICVGVVMFLLAIVIARTFYRCHRDIFRSQKIDRIIETIKMIVCPPIAIRSADQLSINTLSEFNPLVLAYIFLCSEKFKAFSAEYLRCLKHPIIDSSIDKQVLDVIEWQNMVLLDMTEEFLKTVKHDPEQLLFPPIPKETTSVAYCPRCLTESNNNNGECPDCVGVTLIPYKS
jgi:hypothetical protein